MDHAFVFQLLYEIQQTVTKQCESVLPIHHSSIWSKKNSKVYKFNITKDYFWKIASLTPSVVYCNTLVFTL